MSDRLTIDELARAAGMTVRNVRSHQTRGLLPPPVLQGRTGFYGEEHVARLRLIKEMQAAGFNLNAIKTLLDAAPRGLGQEVLEFQRSLMAPWGPEEPEIFEARELLAMFGDPPQEVVDRAIELRLVVLRDDGRVEVPLPSILRAGLEIAEIGVPQEQTLNTLEALVRHANAISASFIELFLNGVWRPFVQRGERPEEWPRVRQSLERLRPLASEALMAAFQRSMKSAVEEAFGRELETRSRNKGQEAV